MAEAWHAPQAWEGLTTVGGGTMPAAIAGQAGLSGRDPNWPGERS